MFGKYSKDGEDVIWEAYEKATNDQKLIKQVREMSISY